MRSLAIIANPPVYDDMTIQSICVLWQLLVDPSNEIAKAIDRVVEVRINISWTSDWEPLKSYRQRVGIAQALWVN